MTLTNRGGVKKNSSNYKLTCNFGIRLKYGGGRSDLRDSPSTPPPQRWPFGLPVDEVHLSNDVDKVEKIADKVFDGVKVVRVERVLHVLHQGLTLLFPLVQGQGSA